MSTSDTREDPAPIAGEPAQENTHKQVPDLTGQNAHKKKANTQQRKIKSRWLSLVQTAILVAAISLSASSYIAIESFSQQPGIAGSDAEEMLVRIEGRVADSICTEGGAEIIIGSDQNRDGTLQESEVSSTTKVCHGKEGLSGPQGSPGPATEVLQSLIAIETIEVGNQTCPQGGIALFAGIDFSNDGTLDSNEVATTNVVCDGVIGINGVSGNNGERGMDGQNGASALVEQRQPPESVCAVGIILEFGVDDGTGLGVAHDGIMQQGEVRESLQICSTPLAYGPITDMFANSGDGVTANCDSMTWMKQQQRLILSGVNGVDGCELWVSEGTDASSQLLLDINPSGDSLPGRDLGFTAAPTESGERMFFDADDGTNGRELWVSDATKNGTLRIIDGVAGIALPPSPKLVEWNNGVVVVSVDDGLLWTNGTVTTNVFNHPHFSINAVEGLNNSTSMLSSFSTEFLSSNGNQLWFSAKGLDDVEPHLLSALGVLHSWDLNPLGNSEPASHSWVGTSAIMVAEADNGRQLVRLFEDGTSSWLTSLTHQGTGLPTQHVAKSLGIHVLGDVLVFDALTSGVDATVWSHHLISGLTQMLSSDILAPGDWAGGLVEGDVVWFDCVAPGVAHEVCTSDGTVAGTKVMTDLRTGIASSNIVGFAAYNQEVFAIASGQINGIETGSCLWHLDQNGPIMVYDPWAGNGNNSASGTYGTLLMSEHHALFMSHDGLRGHEVHAWSHGAVTGDWLIW